MVCDGQIFFSFWNFFLPFYPTNNLKIKFSKNEKSLEISSFFRSVQKLMILCYTVPEIWHVMNVIIIFHFWLFFALFLLVMKLIRPKTWKSIMFLWLTQLEGKGMSFHLRHIFKIFFY